MNDRFKFRSWHEPTKTMEYNGLWTGRDWDKKLCDCNFKLMQCTGLKDKNGKLIYEGDLVKQNYNQYIIEGCIGGFHCINTNTKSSYQFCVLSKEHIEVIGNIYENKELLDD